jgi:chromosome segregation protein
MHIKKLEIAGFKSFVDRTVIHFDHDVIGIVGPNGCGKSNIVDAIRWCLGEQSAKHLRGRAMEDVIFNGSESRTAAGMAEVTITFDNSNPEYAESLPLEYKDYAEIAVTRRLFRDGTSEYLINKTQVRLKDITDLFPPLVDRSSGEVRRPGGLPGDYRGKLNTIRDKLDAEKAKKDKDLKAAPPEKK